MDISIERLLDMPVVRVLSSEMNEHEILMQVEFSQHYSICHKCGQKATEYVRAGETLRLRHLPIFNRPVYLYLHTKRYRCLNCDDRPTTTQNGDWYDKDAHCTKAFAEYLLLEAVGSTLADVERKHGVAYEVLRGLINRYLRGGVDWDAFNQLLVLGIDEIALKKGHHDYVTIVSTRDEDGHPRLLAVIEGRKKEPLVAFLQSIPERLRAAAKEVCTDLNEGFINAAKEVLPQAELVADRFHVAKLYGDGFESVRKSEMKSLKKALKPEEYAAFKGTMWMLRKHRKDLTEDEGKILDLLFECSPDLHKAYDLREELYQIFEAKQTKQSAQEAFRNWIAEVKRSSLTCFNSFITTLEERINEITNYFNRRSSSGWVEGLNNKIKVLKRRCYGLTNIANFFRRLWLDLNGFEAFAQ
jgi:transposase